MCTQAMLIEDLKHAHAHTNAKLREIAHEAHAEITRLQRELDGERRLRLKYEIELSLPLWKRIFGLRA